VAVADVNGDGKPDLIVGNSNGTVGVLLGNGDGTFQPAVIYGSGGSGAIQSGSVVVADINGDGKPDMLVANAISSVVGVLLGNGDGTFQPAVSYGSGGISADSVAVADVNGDGKPDLLVTNQCASDCGGATDGTVAVLLGNGDGTFQAAITFGSGGAFADSIAVSDVNADGKLDLLVANLCLNQSGGECFGNGTLGVLLNNTGSQSATATTLTSSQNPSTHGQPITFTATVTTSGPVAPTGTVNFKWGPDGIGAGTLNASGVATFTTSILKPGPYKITAVYKGDAANLGSTSAIVYQGVEPK
jgi:hypothetical protein